MSHKVLDKIKEIITMGKFDDTKNFDWHRWYIARWFYF